ncbi:MAG TPA: cytochrome c oxidase subunit II [Actinomycetota bacterium]|nr:cytochrome c oxidase subunit II [Actinomycetota bacterium]
MRRPSNLKVSAGRSPRLMKRAFFFACSLSLFVLSACAQDTPQGFLEPEGPIARRADQLWDVTFAIAVVIFVIVQGLLIFAIIRFRERPGREARQFHGNTKVEIVLTVIPALILAGLAVPTVSTVMALSKKPTGDILEIKVLARQFWWEYEYTDLGVITANEMHVPVDTPVYLTLEGDDVIHSFWIPKLTGKQDVVPGRTNNMQFEAENAGETYLGQCTEYCGLSHANMRIRVYTHTQEEFDNWVASQKEPASRPTGALAREGERIFMEEQLPAGGQCINCHAIQGTDAQARTGPDLTHFAARETFAGAIFQNSPDALGAWLRDPPGVKPGSLMPDYGLSEEQIEALVAYLRSLD